jgi:hypothetical protein
MDAAQLIAKLAEVSPPLQPLDLGFFQTLQGPNNPSYSEFANTATMVGLVNTLMNRAGIRNR